MEPLYGDEREVKLLKLCLPSFGFPLYIGKEVDAAAERNQQTERIILMCDRDELPQKPIRSTQKASLVELN